MKTSLKKGNRWLYIFLVFMILALLAFSLLPLFSNSFSSSKTNHTIENPNQQLTAQINGYQLVLQREPDNQIALRGLLEAQLKLGDIAASIPALEKLATLNPDNLDYTILVAQAKQQMADYEGAATTYRQILATNPGEIKALKGLINLYLLQKQPEAAIGILDDTLKTALVMNTSEKEIIDTTSVKLLLGEVYLSEKRNKEAITIYDQIIKEKKDDFRPLLAKGILLEKTGDKEGAKTFFKASLEIAPPEYKEEIKQLLLSKK